MLAMLLLFFNLADVGLTKLVLRMGGKEANPLMRPLMNGHYGPLAMKTVVALGVGLLLFASPPDSKLTDRSVAAVLVLYVLVTGWNLGVLLHTIPVK
jgi:hypothetical protein